MNKRKKHKPLGLPVNVLLKASEHFPKTEDTNSIQYGVE